MPKEVIVVGMIALAGFLAGGAYTTWKTARTMAVILALLAVLAAAGGVTWFLS